MKEEIGVQEVAELIEALIRIEMQLRSIAFELSCNRK